MCMDWGRTPTPRELAVWLATASPGTATGRYRWSSGSPNPSINYGWIGEPPLLVMAPPDVELAVSFRAPGDWRLDLPEGPLARASDGVAVLWQSDGRVRGRRLQQLIGPDRLLKPEAPRGEPDGEVAQDTLLGRMCWRWTSGEDVRWVDDATGCLLRLDSGDRCAAFSEIRFGESQDDMTYALGDLSDAKDTTVPVPTDAEAQRALPFTVPWWPDGCSSLPVAGDPFAPSLLVELHTGDDDRWCVGVAPAGTPAPVRLGLRSRRWDGDGVSLSLSWSPTVPDGLVDRVAASMPSVWP